MLASVRLLKVSQTQNQNEPNRTEQNFTERAGHKWFNICMQHAPIMPICSQIKLNIIVTFIRILFAMLSNHNASLNTFAGVQIFTWNDKSIHCSTNYSQLFNFIAKFSHLAVCNLQNRREILTMNQGRNTDFGLTNISMQNRLHYMGKTNLNS